MQKNDEAYRYDPKSYITVGTRWEYDDVIRDTLSRIDIRSEHYDVCGLPMISNGQVAYVNNTDSHGLIIGSTGSKKTRLFVMPMMEMFAKAGESVVCTDPKGELFTRTSGLYAREGYDIQVINLRDPLRSNGWNPLYVAHTLYKQGNKERATSMINDLAASIFPEKPGPKADPFWGIASRSLFSGLCHLLVEYGDQIFPESVIHIGSIPTLADNLCCSELPPGTTNDLYAGLPAHSMARSNLRSIVTCSEKTFSNIMVSYNAPMQIFYSRPSLSAMLSTNDVCFERLGQRKSILYIIMPDEKTTLHMLVSLIIKACYETLIEEAQRMPERTLPVRVNFMLDEFCNLPAIPDMSAMISAARSRNIRMYLVVQSLYQLVSKYGDDANTIRGNCGDWVFLTSRELSLLEELSQLCGTNLRTERPLISVSQLQRLDKEKGEALILCGRLYPYIARLADIDEYPFARISPISLPVLRNDVMAFSDRELKNAERKLVHRRAAHMTPKDPDEEPVTDEDTNAGYDIDKACRQLVENMKRLKPDNSTFEDDD